MDLNNSNKVESNIIVGKQTEIQHKIKIVVAHLLDFLLVNYTIRMTTEEILRDICLIASTLKYIQVEGVFQVDKVDR